MFHGRNLILQSSLWTLSLGSKLFDKEVKFDLRRHPILVERLLDLTTPSGRKNLARNCRGMIPELLSGTDLFHNSNRKIHFRKGESVLETDFRNPVGRPTCRWLWVAACYLVLLWWLFSLVLQCERRIHLQPVLIHSGRSPTLKAKSVLWQCTVLWEGQE